MLTELTIQNYTIIDSLNVNFHNGFSVITGETGAGKSIILGAIGLLTGNRADPKTLRNPEKKCIVEAIFDIRQNPLLDFFQTNEIDTDGEECILRREILPSGKSRSFINDTPVGLSQMKELTAHLIDIHSQHQNLLLETEDFQLSVLDTVANNQELLTRYHTAYANMKQAEQQLNAAKQEIEATREQEDFLRFQFNELSNAHLQEGEEDDLIESINTLSHSEEIKEGLYHASQLLSSEQGVVSQLKQVDVHLDRVSSVYPALSELPERINSLLIESKDISSEVSAHLEKIDFDPAELDKMQIRLDQLQSLKQKYKVDTIGELITQLSTLNTQLSALTDSSAHLEDLESAVADSKKECLTIASNLTKLRQDAARMVEERMKKDLQALGMPKVQFQVQLSPILSGLSPKGSDAVEYLFSANNTTLLPISQIASGGEIARVMLCLKALLSETHGQPTIIFDEIDTGVSGAIAERMAFIMDNMGKAGRQVISITHLPQIAARGLHHYRVEKHDTADGTNSNMKELNKEERIHELAQMLSGVNITEAATLQAQELLKN